MMDVGSSVRSGLPNLAFSKVVCQWKFGFGSLAFFGSISLLCQFYFDLAVTIKTGIILPPLPILMKDPRKRFQTCPLFLELPGLECWWYG